MARSGFDEDRYNKARERLLDYPKKIVKARKKAGRIIGRKIVKQRKAGLESASDGKLSSRRKKAVRSIVARKDGTLIVFDHAPMAALQETGGVIKAKDKLLRINVIKPGYVSEQDTFVTKKGYVFEKGKYGTSKLKQRKPRLIAVLKSEVVIEELPESAKLDNISEKNLVEFRDLFAESLFD